MSNKSLDVYFYNEKGCFRMVQSVAGRWTKEEMEKAILGWTTGE